MHNVNNCSKRLLRAGCLLLAGSINADVPWVYDTSRRAVTPPDSENSALVALDTCTIGVGAQIVDRFDSRIRDDETSNTTALNALPFSGVVLYFR